MFSKIAPKTTEVANIISAIMADCQGTEAGTTGAPSGSTSKPVTGEGESEIKISQTWCQEPAGFERRALVRQPTTSTPGEKVPLVICMHGNGGSANLAAWKDLWDKNLVVAAEGYDRSWNIWAENSKAPDVEFILALIQKVGEENPNADMDNVVLVGSSNGAGMISRLLIETANPRPFHKVFPMVSTMIQEQYNGGKFYKMSSGADCEDNSVYDIEVTPASPGPEIYQFHGTEDGAVPYSGGTTFAQFLGAQDTVFAFAKAFGYSGSQLADEDGEATSVDNVFKYSYLDGQVNHYKVVGGTHGNTSKSAWDIIKAIINP
jgi:poly(3-hydroxybutyrate) depolymerase